jgi:hypothetical protein
MLNSILVAVAANAYNLPEVTTDSGLVSNILRIVFGIAGALALLMVILAGFKYITSAGDPQSVAKAKNTLIYSIIGLAVCILAEVIVSFVVGQL